ncbi:MAG: tetratricopeptide repeat protein [Rhodospirillaceae bacterium]|nr:tetratricopeptide repeat protein [Rhodospirillaceae bacterium]
MSEELSNIDTIAERRTLALGEFSKGNAASAQRLLEKILRSHPDDPETWVALGQCKENLGRHQDAVTAYQHAWKFNSKDARTAYHLGRLLIQLTRYSEAATILTAGVTLNPASEAMWCDLGTAQTSLRLFSDAENSYRHAAALNPRYTLAILNLGSCLREQARPEEAIACFKQALTLDSGSTEAVTRLATTLSDIGQIDIALDVLNQFLKARPGSVECHQNKALILLRAGRLGAGFEEYEWRLYPSPVSVTARPFPMPRWQGDSLKDRKLLIWLEQGLGDEILSLRQWNSFLNSSEGNQCIVECDRRLVEIIERSFPSVTVVARQTPAAQATKTADVTCPAWSAPHLLGAAATCANASKSYLTSDSAKKSAFRTKYRELARGRKVIGLSWSSKAQKGDLKTPQINDWDPIVGDQDYFFVSLQHAFSDDDVARLSAISEGRFYVDQSVDTTINFDDHAAQVSSLDATVTISNSTAHLAGALGVNVATLIPSGYGGFWYWFRDRLDSPWYSSMRVCRQNNAGHWPSAVADAHNWLKGLPA